MGKRIGVTSVSLAPSLLLQLGHVRKFILVGNNNYCALRANAASDVAVVRFNHCANGTLIGGLRGKTDLLVLRATDRSHMPGITKDGRQLECTAKGAGVPGSVYVVAGTLPRTVSLPNTTVVEQFTRSRHERFCYQRSFLNKSTPGRSCSTGVEAYALLKHLFRAQSSHYKGLMDTRRNSPPIMTFIWSRRCLHDMESSLCATRRTKNSLIF